MTEQQTIQDLAHTAEIWGPVGTAIFIIVIFIAYQIYSNVVVKKKAFDPITQIKLDINDRPTYSQLVSRLKDYQLKEVAEAQLTGIEKRLSHIERLLNQINDKIK